MGENTPNHSFYTFGVFLLFLTQSGTSSGHLSAFQIESWVMLWYLWALRKDRWKQNFAPILIASCSRSENSLHVGFHGHSYLFHPKVIFSVHEPGNKISSVLALQLLPKNWWSGSAPFPRFQDLISESVRGDQGMTEVALPSHRHSDSELLNFLSLKS